MKYLALALSALLVGCSSFSVQLPSQQAAAACGLAVSDTRPDPGAMLFKKSVQVERMVTTPGASESIRQSVCAAMPTAPAARFVLTDFECTSTGFWDIQYVVDLRGRVERDGRQTVEIRTNKVLDTHDGSFPGPCQEGASAVVSAAARDVAQALR